MIRRFFILWLLMIISLAAKCQNIFNCSSGFSTTTSASCGVDVSFNGSNGTFTTVGTTGNSPSVFSGTSINLVPSGASHVALSLMYQTAVNVQAFTTTYKFIPDGQNVSFVINNATVCGQFGCNNGPGFSSGAGCEGGFYQAFQPNNPTANNIFALMFDSYGSNIANSGTFTGSSAQLYMMNQSPCNPNDSGPNYWGSNKILTSPVQLNSPPGTQNTSTGHTYQATITYDGTNLTESVFDVTAGNSCPGTSCFIQTWSAVDIPAMVSGNTGYIGIIGATGTTTSSFGLYVVGWEYTVNTAPSLPSLSSYTTQSYSGASFAAAPTFSPAAGSYSGTQNVTISSATPSSNICYLLATPGPNLILPWMTNQGSSGNSPTLGPCQQGTPYTGPVAVSSSQTLYAVAGTTFTGLPSAMTAAAYTIGGTPQAAAPTFAPAAGTYTGAQTVTASTTSSGCSSHIYFDTNPTPVTNQTTLTVSSSETVYAYVHNCPGFTDSAISHAAYVIDVGAATPTFSPVAGTYSSTQSVTVSTTSGGAIICTNTTGSPHTNGITGCASGSTLYTGPISVSATETLYAVAGGTGFTDSSPGSAAYTILTAASTPTFSPVAGTYTSAQLVSIAKTTGTLICYTNDGSTPATNGGTGCNHGTVYSGSISVATDQTLKAVVGGTGFADSPVATAVYAIKAAAPTFSPGPGTYAPPQAITITKTTGSVICYNATGSPATNGGTGCASGSTLYTAPVTITASQTLYAVAGGTGLTDSTVASAAYVIFQPTQTPVWSPASGLYVMPITATVSVPAPNASTIPQVCYTSGATCVPGSTGTAYACTATPCNINVSPATTEQLCASAQASGYGPSVVGCSGVYTRSTTATGDGRGVQPQPQYPAVMFTTGCTKVAETQMVALSTSFNVDPLNPTASDPGHMDSTGGTSLEPASETKDTTLQAALNADTTGCVEVVMGGSGESGLVEGEITIPTHEIIVLDPGTTLFMSRNPSDFGGGSCGTVSAGGNTSCHDWITVASGAINSGIMGDGVLDGRCWDKASSGGGNGFCWNRVATYAWNHGNSWAGITATTPPGGWNPSNNYVAYGPNMMNWEGSCTGGNCNDVLYNVILKDSGNFNILAGDGLSGFTFWGIGIYSAGEVSNSDGWDPSYCASNYTLANSFISVGDNHISYKANSGKGGGCATQAISVLNLQTGAGIGVTTGYESTASSGPGVTNILHLGLVQKASNNDNGQQVGHGIWTGEGQGGTVTNETFENTCLLNYAGKEESLKYDMSDSGTFSGINELNTTIVGSSPVALKGAPGRVSSITFDNVTTGSVSGSYSYVNTSGKNVSFTPSGTGVTNTITNPGGNTPFPCTSTTWQPIHGDLTFKVGSVPYYTSYTTATSSQAIVLQAVLRPTTAVNTKESTALTQAVGFYDNGTLLGTAAIAGGAAQGTLASYSVTAGSGAHTYTAVYSGDSNYPGVTYNFGSVTVNVGSSNPQIIGPTQFQGAVVIQ